MLRPFSIDLPGEVCRWPGRLTASRPPQGGSDGGDRHRLGDHAPHRHPSPRAIGAGKGLDDESFPRLRFGPEPDRPTALGADTLDADTGVVGSVRCGADGVVEADPSDIDDDIAVESGRLVEPHPAEVHDRGDRRGRADELGKADADFGPRRFDVDPRNLDQRSAPIIVHAHAMKPERTGTDMLD